MEVVEVLSVVSVVEVCFFFFFFSNFKFQISNFENRQISKIVKTHKKPSFCSVHSIRRFRRHFVVTSGHCLS